MVPEIFPFFAVRSKASPTSKRSKVIFPPLEERFMLPVTASAGREIPSLVVEDVYKRQPLPSSILISVDSLDNAGAIAQYVGTLEGVEDIQYYQETVEKLTEVTNFLQIASLVVMAFLVVISVVVVSNTVKLTVFARAKEIQIMKYVGATNWFIRGPFLAEGIIIGVLASLVATGLIALIYDRIIALIGTQVLAIVSSPLIPVGYMTGNMIIIFLALGVSIGAWGSIISMRRFLDT